MAVTGKTIGLEDLTTSDPALWEITTAGAGPQGSLPLTAEMLLERPSGDIFGLTQNAGMGWDPRELGRPQFLILSTQGGIRAPDGTPIALGYHTGHWEVGLLMQAAAEELRALGCLPFAAFCTDPCDGRTQGTIGMMDSLPYRNDAAQVLAPADPLAADAARRARRRHVRQGAAGHDDGAGGHARPAVRAGAGRRHAAAARRRGRRQGAVDRRPLRPWRDDARSRRRPRLSRVRLAGRRLSVPRAPRRRRRWSPRRSGMSLPHSRAGAVRAADLARHGAALGARAGGHARREA